MTNHIHLLASPETVESLPKTLQSLGRRYVQYFNYRYKRTGTLWEGRYRATVVEAETYLFECMRYIELNPVRAGMVAQPNDFPWSSYRANAEGKIDILVTPHLEYQRLGSSAGEREIAYRAFVKEPMEAEQLTAVRDATNKGWALGGGRFQEKIERLTQRRTMPLPKGRPKKSGD
jgi:putative transposase